MVTARFVLSAASATDFPTTGFPEIAMVGRSNVGKSTLINALVNQKVARTSAAPGKTRLANYYLIDSGGKGPGSSLYFVDLPGYGYARGGAASVETFEALTAQYFDPGQRDRRALAGILHLIDSRHPDLPTDAAAHEWLGQTELPSAVIATKVDKLSRSDRTRTLRVLRSLYRDPVLEISALEGSGLDDVWKTIRSWSADAAR